MALVRWEPFSPRSRSRFPQWMDDEFNLWGEASEGLNVYETDDNVVVEANVPGIKEENIEVTIENGAVNIHGEAGYEEKEEKGKKYYKKKEKRSFSYSTRLPRSVDTSKAEAEVEKGVVKLTIPIAEEEKTKRIEVKSKK